MSYCQVQTTWSIYKNMQCNQYHYHCQPVFPVLTCSRFSLLYPPSCAYHSLFLGLGLVWVVHWACWKLKRGWWKGGTSQDGKDKLTMIIILIALHIFVYGSGCLHLTIAHWFFLFCSRYFGGRIALCSNTRQLHRLMWRFYNVPILWCRSCLLSIS